MHTIDSIKDERIANGSRLGDQGGTARRWPDRVDEATLAAADLVVQIPMAGTVESFNIEVVTGISIHELRMRTVLAMLTDRIRNRGSVGTGLDHPARR